MSDDRKVPVSVVVVSYHTKELLRRCLACLGDVDEVIVVDNASTDGSVEMVRAEFPRVLLIESQTNLGFGAANNVGVRAAKNDLILFLNSDAFAHPGAIARLSKAFDDPEIVAVGGMLLNEDGSVQSSCAKQLTLWAVFAEQMLLESVLHAYWVHPSRETDVEQVMGACLMVRGKQTFDERIFLYCEDTELCHRLRQRGRIRFVPDAKFTHLLGSSSTSNRWLSVARYNRGKELYFALHQGPGAMLACFLLNRLGALIRFAGWSFLQLLSVGTKGKGKPQLFWKVLTCPKSGPPRPDGKPS